MKKKALALFIAITMTSGMLAGCGSSGEKAETDAAATETDSTDTESVEDETSAASEKAGTVTTKITHMGDREVETEVVDLGITGEFSYWSAFTGDSATWDQERVDAFNEAYADLGIKCNVQFVPDGAGINNGKLLSAISGGSAPDLLVTDNATSAYQYAAEGSFMPLDHILGRNWSGG